MRWLVLSDLMIYTVCKGSCIGLQGGKGDLIDVIVFREVTLSKWFALPPEMGFTVKKKNLLPTP